MKRAIQLFIGILLAAVILMTGTGCRYVIEIATDLVPKESAAFTTVFPTPAATGEVLDYAPQVIFYEAKDTGAKSPIYVNRDILLTYETAYPNCNGTLYKQLLSEDELLVYNALLYAMEHCYDMVVLTVQDPDMDFFKPREFLSLDSPLLEQNYSSKEGVSIAGYRATYVMDHFNQEFWDLKMQALSMAEDIVASIPDGADTDIARMEYLYDYVRSHVAYRLYEKGEDPHYLYDALCVGETVCDGYSNALSLLFHMAGIECCEAMGANSEDESGDGHTWVLAPLDGTFYNFDVTNDAVENDGYEAYRCYFGISNKAMNQDEFDYEELRPVCDDESRDLIMADGKFTEMLSYETEREAAQICNSRAANGKMTTLLGFQGAYTDEEVDAFVDAYIDWLEYGESLRYLTLYNKGRTLVLTTIK